MGAGLLKQHWAGPVVVTRGQLHHADRLHGLVALSKAERVGLLTYSIVGDQCEIVTLNALVKNVGIGTALLEAVGEVAVAASCRRLWLITTNDNLPAQAFYKQRGFTVAAVHRNAMDRSRELKPEIPRIGLGGEAIRDDVEFELELPGKVLIGIG